MTSNERLANLERDYEKARERMAKLRNPINIEACNNCMDYLLGQIKAIKEGK